MCKKPLIPSPELAAIPQNSDNAASPNKGRERSKGTALRERPCRSEVRYRLARFGDAHFRIISGQTLIQHQPLLVSFAALSATVSMLVNFYQ
ncbi:hypothetical protein [Acaryochloris sp. CCMEE 5410]|uniref:hypothetical protein n=1 Tax=Acaryochloris sp. CCMEE 5410 TaxID=310037 RepID=UPI0002484176|nr:hypothetical protein [Acaryochloris sp. CCMEE 5410]KAI9129816.1 hypothetical protein ON05_032335 [Acaryochloris sp. CCMEE 5410]